MLQATGAPAAMPAHVGRNCDLDLAPYACACMQTIEAAPATGGNVGRRILLAAIKQAMKQQLKKVCCPDEPAVSLPTCSLHPAARWAHQLQPPAATSFMAHAFPRSNGSQSTQRPKKQGNPRLHLRLPMASPIYAVWRAPLESPSPGARPEMRGRSLRCYWTPRHCPLSCLRSSEWYRAGRVCPVVASPT